MQSVLQDFVLRNELSRPLRGPCLISKGESQSGLQGEAGYVLFSFFLCLLFFSCHSSQFLLGDRIDHYYQKDVFRLFPFVVLFSLSYIVIIISSLFRVRCMRCAS